MCLERGTGPSPGAKDGATAYSPLNWPGPLEARKWQDIGCSKDALTTINSEVNSSGVALSSGSHGLVKFNHYSQIEKSAWSHKRL